ncbi:TRAP transporter large permease [Cuneatibacter sp. NSJ-177]|uniref:TRAP transporter large permease n=1 Tax=Cuneatibacter sp. NSJ-177 TaxID=2931401 RepID=UPI001FD34F02|nr:TRAP transporter large permease [Cuneatibacter sp. NSJ-177]MCJ7837389.1 TRAP transporter large permease [Cuneatibacter sp. NSJ-177]
MDVSLVAWIFLVFVICLLCGIPVVIAMAAGALLPSLLGMAGATTFSALVRSIFGSAENTTLIAIPLFILAGNIMSEGQIAKKLYDIFAYFVGNKTGGLPCAAVMTCLFYGAISGSAPATAAAVGGMTFPLLVKLGYEKTFVAALIATAGGLGVIIPPSIPFVLYSSTTGVSLGDMFIAGFLPGFLMGALLMVYCVVYCKRSRCENKELLAENYQRLHKSGFGRVLLDGIWALLSPVIVLGGIYTGIFTPTEAACASVFYSLIVSIFVYRSIRIRDLPKLFAVSVRGLAPICLILPLATAFGRVLVMLKAPARLSEFIASSFHSTALVLLVVLIVFFILGMFIDTAPAIVVMAPILLPTMKSLGVNLVQFGIIMTVCLAIGCVTPPFGVNLFVTSSLSKIPPMTIGRKAFVMIGVFTLALLLITYIPGISTMFL